MVLFTGSILWFLTKIVLGLFVLHIVADFFEEQR